jgi:nicotinamidase-related amidase
MNSEYTAPRYEQSALITIDVQRDFLDRQPFEITGTSAIVPTIGRLAQFFRSRVRPIDHVVRLYRSDGSNVDASRRHLIEQGAELVRPGSAGSQLAEPLLPAADIALDSEVLLAGGFQVVGRKDRRTDDQSRTWRSDR